MKSSHSLIKAGDAEVSAQAWAPAQVAQPRMAPCMESPVEKPALQQADQGAPPLPARVEYLPLRARDKQGRSLVRSKEAGAGVRQWMPSELVQAVSEPGAQPGQETSGRAEAALQRARQQAQEITDKASLQAAEIVQEARQRAGEVAQEAHCQGLEDGRRKAEEEAVVLLASANAVLEETRRFRQEILSQSEPSVIELVKNMAAALFGQGFALEPAVLEDTFRQAIAQAKTLGRLQVHLNQTDYDLLGPAWKKLQESNASNPVDLFVDDSIQRGGCLIEGEYGTVDARVDTKLSKVMETVSDTADQHGAAKP